MASHFPQKRPRALDVHRVQGPGASSYRENRDGPLEGTQRRVAPRPSVIGRRFRWDRRRVDPAAWVPARSRAGIQAFSRESPDAKSRGGGPPSPLFLEPARCHSLVFAWWGAAGRWCVYFVAHLRALIWIRILREQGLGERVFRGGSVAPTKASPRGEGFG